MDEKSKITKNRYAACPHSIDGHLVEQVITEEVADKTTRELAFSHSPLRHELQFATHTF